MFVPATFLAPSFLSVGYAVAFAALLILEFMKYPRKYTHYKQLSFTSRWYGGVEPFGNKLQQLMGDYIDKRDSGYFTVTHMYLLLGCAVPLWIASSLEDDTMRLSSTLPPYPRLNDRAKDRLI